MMVLLHIIFPKCDVTLIFRRGAGGDPERLQQPVRLVKSVADQEWIGHSESTNHRRLDNRVDNVAARGRRHQSTLRHFTSIIHPVN